MALGAYQQLDSRDADARYHAAVLHLQVGDFAPALALADTILTESPGHLFGYLVRGTVARFQNNRGRSAQAERDFLAHYPSEMRRSGSSIWSTSRRWMSSRKRRKGRRKTGRAEIGGDGKRLLCAFRLPSFRLVLPVLPSSALYVLDYLHA